MGDLDAARADQDRLLLQLLEEIALVWAVLSRAERALVRDWLDLSPGLQEARRQELLDLATRLRTQVDTVVRRDLGSALHGAYEAGAIAALLGIGDGPVFTIADSTHLLATAQETYRDLLIATKHVEETTKELIRALARAATSEKVLQGQTAVQAGKALAQELRGHQISAIVYKDGSRHGLDEYAGMLLRTKTAEIYQEGGFAQAERLGVEWIEILDNPSCGLASHDDPLKANGLIVTLEQARRYPLSHPNCVRASTPRVDIHSADEARAASPSTTAAQNEDQRQVELTRQEAAARRARRRRLEQRTTRTRAGALVPSSGAALSPAARRAAARVDRRTPGGTP